MKKIILFFICVFSLPAFAQDEIEQPEGMTRDEWRSQVHAQKIVLFADCMNLNEVEKDAFQSIFDDYEADMHECYSDLRKAKLALDDSPSEQDYRKYVNVMVEIQELQSDLRTKFINELAQMFSFEKVYKFCQAEQQFKKKLIKEVAKHKHSLAK